VACDEPVGIQTSEGRKRTTVAQALSFQAQDWQRISMSEGTKGPRLFDWAMMPMLHQWEDDGQHFLLVRRCLDDPSVKTYYFVFVPVGTTLAEMVKAIGARWKIEECFAHRQRHGLGRLRSQMLDWLVSSRHAGDARPGMPCRDLCDGSDRACQQAGNTPYLSPASSDHSRSASLARPSRLPSAS